VNVTSSGVVIRRDGVWPSALCSVRVDCAGKGRGQPVECDVGEDRVSRRIGVGPAEELFPDPVLM